MVAQPPVRQAPTGAPDLALVSLGWRRIQVLLRVRPVDPDRGADLDPAGLRMRHSPSGTLVPLTGWETDDEGTTLRVNVMQGPRQEPLGAGRWELVTLGPRGATKPVALSGELVAEAPTAPMSFPVGQRGTYMATASVSPRAGVFAIVVELDPTVVETEEEPLPGAIGRPGPVGQAVNLVRGAAFAVLLRSMRVLARRNGRRILFSSDSRAELGGNQKLVYDRMVELGLDREFELLTLFKPGIVARRSIRDRLRLPWLFARVDTIVIDDYQPVIYRVNVPDVTILQLWHAVGAFKTVGYSRVGKPGAPNPYGRAHKNYTWATVSAHDDIAVYAEAFGIPESHVVATGIPRVDRMFSHEHRQASLEAVAAAFPETVGRTVILFAPTFRGHGARTATYDVGQIDVEALHALCVERDAVCLVRMHPFVREALDVPAAFRDRIVDASAAATSGAATPIETNDLLFAVDLLVTDYSSIVYEFSTLGRPMLFFAYDLDDYVASRDFYEPYESFVPGRIVRTFPELLDAIRREDYEQEKVEPFARRHFDHLDGGSTDRVIDLITRR
jgi:CDP-glycerol glycerophosphotransferase (TagB/SpsB family)